MQLAAQSGGGNVIVVPQIVGNGGIAVVAYYQLYDVTGGGHVAIIGPPQGPFSIPPGASQTVRSYVLAVQPAFHSAPSADVLLTGTQGGPPLQNTDPNYDNQLATIVDNGTAGSVYPCPFFISFA